MASCTCPDCNGSGEGMSPGTNCSTCHGLGEISCEEPDEDEDD